MLLLDLAEVGHAGEPFVYIGPAGVQDWEDPAKWTGGSGMFSQFPGDSPAAGTLDSANLSVNPLSSSIDLRVNTLGLTVDVVQLGTKTTIIRGVGNGTFTANRIEAPVGQATSIGLFGNIVFPANLLELRPGALTTFRGTLLNHAPVSGVIRTIDNSSQGTLRVESNVVLSDDPSVAGHVRFLNGGLPAATNISGVISDGAAPGGRINFGRGTFSLTADNTYSGVTQIGENHPQVETIIEISTDLAFGTSRIDFSGGEALKTVRAAVGSGTRTLANNIRISRSAEFTGSESFVLNGAVYQSNGRELINRIDPGKSLTINGNIYASDSMDVRDWIFEGYGLTIVNGIIDDSLGFPEVTGASLIKRDNGRVILTNPGVAAYGGQTTVNGGVLQLGNGGAAVGLNGNSVGGSAVGVLEINHSELLLFDSAIGGNLAVNHTGAGTTVLTANSGGNGSINVQAGMFVIDGATGGGTLAVSPSAAIGGSGTIGGMVDISGTMRPGASIGVLTAQDAVFRDDAKLIIELGGIVPQVEYDRFVVNATAQLGGKLIVELFDDFVPQSAEAFTIVSAGSLSGEFGNIANGGRLDTFGGEGSFLVTYDGDTNAVVLSDFLLSAGPGLQGDFNGDGIVDAADYTVWRNHVGESDESNINFNGDGGDVSLADYNLWKAHYGTSNLDGSGSLGDQGHAPVPEPATLVLLLMGLAVSLGGRQRGAGL